MEALHAGIEVDQADRDTSDADDRQAGAVAFALDEPAFLGVDVERIGENVDAVEADFARHANAVSGSLAGLDPGGVDETEFHGASPLSRHDKRANLLRPAFSPFPRQILKS